MPRGSTQIKTETKSRQREAAPAGETPVQPAHGGGYGPVNRTVLYVPRFARHLRRRMHSGMPMPSAWRSARMRMRDYRWRRR